MPQFFNGRLLITPATASRIDDSALANTGLTVGNAIAFLGECEGGIPGVPMKFGNPSDALAVLRSGDLLLAVQKAFSPSNETNAPQTVIAIRVNPGTQSALILKDAVPNNCILLTSVGYGSAFNRIRTKLESGSIAGYRATVVQDDKTFTRDNLHRQLFTVVHAAGGAGTITITNAALTIHENAGGADTVLDFLTYDTVQKVVDAINAIGLFTAETTAPYSRAPTLNAIDGLAGFVVGNVTPVAITADVEALREFYNGTGILIATRTITTSQFKPTLIPFTRLAGATGVPAVFSDWAVAFDALQSQDVRWFVPLTSNPALHASAQAHADFMSSVGKERRGFVGGPLGETQAQAKAACKALNSDRIARVYGGVYDYDENGDLVLLAPYFTASYIAAGFAGLDPAETMTNKSITVRGLEFTLRNPTDTDDMIESGALCMEETRGGFRVVKAISTWLVNRNFNRVEISNGAGYDYLARTLREAVDPLRGKIIRPQLLGQAYALAESALRELSRPQPAGVGVLVGDEASPPFRSLAVTAAGDTLRFEVQASVGIPNNYNLITIFAVPYSGTVAG